MYLNINGIPQNKNNHKNQLILNNFKNFEADIFGLTETNLNWPKLDQSHNWRERTTGIWETSHSTIGFNRKDIHTQSPFQPGGTLLHSTNKSCHRIITTDLDPSGLGRWCSTKYRGRHDVTLRVVCAYRPCKPHTAGPSTVYSQHQRVLDEHDDERCPRQAFLDDIILQLDQWRRDGDQIIVMIDCNDDIRKTNIKEAFESVGLKDSITQGREDNAPGTYHRGSYPIDGIFTSTTIDMIQGGYLPFGDMPSDHRTLWIDISYENAFGYKMPSIINPVARRLKSNIPTIRKKFNNDYKLFLRRHHLEERLYSLQSRLTIPIHPDDAKEYESILSVRSDAIKYADKRCRRVFLGAVPFSDKMKQAMTQIELWKAVKTKQSGARYSMNKLRRLETKAGTKNTLQITPEDVTINLKKALRTYWDIKKKGDEYRASFLQSKAEDLANDNGGEPTTIYTQLIQREKLRQAHKRIKYTINNNRGGGITKVEVLSPNGDIIELTTKPLIESACIEENKLKYRQTENTPCMEGQLRRDLGFLGLTESSTQIINGTYTCPERSPPFTTEFFNQFQKPQLTTDPPPNIMTTPSFTDGWKKMKEATSAASITGIHFGHLKSASLDPHLADFEATIAHIPYSTGYNPVQWQHSVCCMIKKKADVDLVTKLRTIVLTEADFNFNNKKLGRESLMHAEQNNLIAKEQYGSRRGKRAIEHALNKRLLYDIIRQNRRPGALCSNGAKSCYNRVLHSITMLAFRRLGFPVPPVECMLRSIQQMKHYIRTTFGNSHTYFSSNSTAIPFQGILQGNGAAPTIWVLISTPLLNMLRSAQNGAHMKSPISKEPNHIVGFAFVDDTDLVCFRQGELILEDAIMENMQQGIDRWEGGLKLTGGAIVPEKSWIYPIAFDFDNAGKWKYKKVETIDHIFSVQDHTGQRRILEKIEPDIGKETLGVMLSPDGNNKQALEELQRKAQKWSDYVITGHLKANEARLALDSTIIRTLSYPLLALTLSESECNKIMKPILDASLAKTHVCRNFPHAVVYGPKSEKGLGFTNLYIQQGLSHINSIQQHAQDKDSITGSFIRNSIESLKIELGLGMNIFTLPYDEYHHMATDCWIKQSWHFAWKYDILIQENITNNVKLRRQNDQFIMDAIVNLQCYSGAELKHINRCRLHLQVTSLSDITTACGQYFSTLAYTCQFDPTIPHYYHWPIQPRPHNYSRRLWKQAIKRAFPRTGQRLNTQLGQWTDGDRNEWKWFHQRSTGYLFRRFRGRLRLYSRTSRAGQIGRYPRFRYCTQATSLPSDVYRATIKRIDRHTVQLTGTTTRILEDTPPSQATLQKREDAFLRQEMMESYNQHNCTDQEILLALLSNMLKVVSDGSFLKHIQLGTAAWVLACSRHQYITGQHFTPGSGSSQCSHRSELSGILGAILHVNDICTTNHVESGQIELQCDGLGAIEVVQDLYPPINPSRKHFDIIHSIHQALQVSPLTWTFNHVSGHRDDEAEVDDLSDWEYWNVIADYEAKEKLKNISHMENWTELRPSYPPYTRVTVHHLCTEGSHEIVSSQLSRTCTESILTTRIREYWKGKNYFTTNSEKFVDWPVIQKSINALPSSRQRWLSKWTTGMCGVGKWLKRWKWQDHSDCPRCGQQEEDVQHVLLCNETSALALWEDSVQQLGEWMRDHDCDPEMNDAICLSLIAWHNGSPLPPIVTENHHL